MTEAGPGPTPSPPLDTLKRYYEDRTLGLREAVRRGDRVAARVGNTAPSELILAAGFTPLMISADLSRPTPTANLYMDDIIAPETKAIFEAAVSGELEALELLILTRAYDRLYYYLKEIYRLGRAPKLPPLQMLDLMQSRRDSVAAWNASRLELVRRRLERAAGRPITEDALRAAIAATNTVRALQRQVQDLRDSGAVTGADAMTAIGAGYFMGPDAYAEVLGRYLADVQARPPLPSRPRLLVLSSEPLQHLGLHQALEGSGALVVAEDNWWGSRAAGEDIDPTLEPMDAILRKYWMDTQSHAVHPPAAREAWLLEQARRKDVDGIIFHMPPSDHQLGWDYPRLAQEVTSIGKASLVLRQDVSTTDGRAAAHEQIPAFLTSL